MKNILPFSISIPLLRLQMFMPGISLASSTDLGEREEILLDCETDLFSDLPPVEGSVTEGAPPSLASSPSSSSNPSSNRASNPSANLSTGSSSIPAQPLAPLHKEKKREKKRGPLLRSALLPKSPQGRVPTITWRYDGVTLW